MAFFKYDENKPQRLSFLNVNAHTGHMEEWCIRKFYASTIQVVPVCDSMPDASDWAKEAFFHEVFENNLSM
jgi:hypothetical protein